MDSSAALLPCGPAAFSLAAENRQRETRSRTEEANAALLTELVKVGIRQLHKHQIEGVRRLICMENILDPITKQPTNTGGILADDMGLGKTRQFLSLILATWTPDADSSTHSTATLIVCAKSLFTTWQGEIKRAVSGKLPCIVLHKNGTDPESKRCLASLDPRVVRQNAVVITNYHALDNASLLACLRSISWRRIILDEASEVKNAETNHAKALSSLNAWSRWCCTATPVENSLDDLKTHIQFIRSPEVGSALFRNVFSRPRDPEKWTKEQEQWTLQERLFLQSIIVRRSKVAISQSPSSGLVLPKLWECKVVHPLTEEEKDTIESARRAAGNPLVAALRETQVTQAARMANADSCTRLNALTNLLQNLRDSDPDKYMFESQRGPAVAPVVQTFAPATTTSKIVIFSLHIDDLTLIEARLQGLQEKNPKRGFRYGRFDGGSSQTQREEAVQDFIGDKTDILLLSLKTGATGLNLQQANVVILYGHWYNPAIERQAIGRVHRIGSPHKDVYAFDMTCKIGESGTADRLGEIKDKKTRVANAVMEFVEDGAIE
ncbi:hypothetical protein HKX48_004581 [Thoreauomyces humboldtii]|nr:hypothetical protein HKX48_004581 [Thoreauomyces humboldtii]